MDSETPQTLYHQTETILQSCLGSFSKHTNLINALLALMKCGDELSEAQICIGDSRREGFSHHGCTISCPAVKWVPSSQNMNLRLISSQPLTIYLLLSGVWIVKACACQVHGVSLREFESLRRRLAALFLAQ